MDYRGKIHFFKYLEYFLKPKNPAGNYGIKKGFKRPYITES